MPGPDGAAPPVLGLRDALALVQAAAPDAGSPLRLGVAVGFTPLHLETFVHAYASRRRPDAAVLVETGTYGELGTALDTLAGRDLDGCVVVLEWPDLDPRLSPRLVGRAEVAPADLLATVRGRLDRLVPAIVRLAGTCPVALAPPSTPFPPMFAAATGRLGVAEAGVRALLAAALATLAADVRLVAPMVDGERVLDLRMSLRADFPYRTEHASGLARDCVTALLPAAAKKGVITDLDDTLWKGIVGEVGPDAVAWDLDGGAQLHALYQQCLGAAAAAGVLIGVASKNDPEVVAAALARPDLVLDPSRVFPIEASWEPKSAAVSRILAAWNIAATDVVVVDDSELELAEIAERHAGITTLRFAGSDAESTLALLARLRTLTSSDRPRTAEDALRIDSLRAGVEFTRSGGGAADYTQFLRDLDATIMIDLGGAHELPRAYELVQKTNQFNLNGHRHESAQWRRLAERPGAVSAVVGYRDRFGDLGAISVLTGTVEGSRLDVDSWVLSCRAFSRAVEHQLLGALADAYKVDMIAFDHVRTPRNHLVGEFLASLDADPDATPATVSVAALRAHPHHGLHTTQVRHRQTTPAA